MPSVIGTDSGSGVNVAANYLKARPSTRFSTRQLAFVEVQITNVQNNYQDSDSNYSRAIRGLQVVAEVYAVGVPASGYFMAVIAQDTDGANNNNDIDNNDASDSQSMFEAIERSLGLNGGALQGVNYKHMYGSGFASGVMTYSDESVAGNNYPA